MSDTSQTTDSAHQGSQGVAYEGPHEHRAHLHVTPALPMTIVFIVLVILTIITVLTAHYVDIPGTGNLILALAIAIVKGTLVMAYFMHLKYDKGMNLVIVYATFFGVILFLGLTMADLASRNQADKLHASEITAGGKLSLNPMLQSSVGKTGDFNVSTWARQNAEAQHANPEPLGDEEPAGEGSMTPEGQDDAADAGGAEPH